MGIDLAGFPAIRQRGVSFVVDCGTAFGSRRRRQFKDRQSAELYALECRKELKLQQHIERTQLRTRAVSLANLTDHQRGEVLDAYRILGSADGLVDAVRYFVDHHPSRAQGITLREMYERFLESKRIANRRERTIRNARLFLRRFVEVNGDRCATAITTDEITGWLLAGEYAQRTWNTYRRAFDGLFRYGIRLRLIARNPVEGVEVSSEDELEVKILTVDQARHLLDTCRQVAPGMVPYFTVGLFAGLRPSNELRGVAAGDIDLARKTVLVRPQTSKKRRSRYVDVSDNLAAWLRAHPPGPDGIYYGRSPFRRVVEASGINWTPDVMRHTFASYHLALYENAPATEQQLGHYGRSGVLFAHYRALVSREDARRFFAIAPD